MNLEDFNQEPITREEFEALSHTGEESLCDFPERHFIGEAGRMLDFGEVIKCNGETIVLFIRTEWFNGHEFVKYNTRHAILTPKNK